MLIASHLAQAWAAAPPDEAGALVKGLPVSPLMWWSAGTMLVPGWRRPCGLAAQPTLNPPTAWIGVRVERREDADGSGRGRWERE